MSCWLSQYQCTVLWGIHDRVGLITPRQPWLRRVKLRMAGPMVYYTLPSPVIMQSRSCTEHLINDQCSKTHGNYPVERLADQPWKTVLSKFLNLYKLGLGYFVDSTKMELLGWRKLRLITCTITAAAVVTYDRLASV